MQEQLAAAQQGLSDVSNDVASSSGGRQETQDIESQLGDALDTDERRGEAVPWPRSARPFRGRKKSGRSSPTPSAADANDSLHTGGNARVAGRDGYATDAEAGDFDPADVGTGDFNAVDGADFGAEDVHTDRAGNASAHVGIAVHSYTLRVPTSLPEVPVAQSVGVSYSEVGRKPPHVPQYAWLTTMTAPIDGWIREAEFTRVKVERISNVPPDSNFLEVSNLAFHALGFIYALNVGDTVRNMAEAFTYLRQCDVANAIDGPSQQDRYPRALLSSAYQLVRVFRAHFDERVNKDLAPYWGAAVHDTRHTRMVLILL